MTKRQMNLVWPIPSNEIYPGLGHTKQDKLPVSTKQQMSKSIETMIDAC